MLNNLPGQIPNANPYKVHMPGAHEEAVAQRYRQHFDLIRPVLKKTGWPQKQGLSESAVNAAYYLFLHSGDVSAYAEWLPALHQACEAGELPWIAYARCYDRWRLGLGAPQRYLTVLRYSDEGNLVIPPWEGDVSTVNEFRAKIGLPLLSQALEEAMRW
jgi:hypothetical protein